MTLGYDLAIAMFASVIFYLFQVYLPEKKKKKNLKKYFQNSVFIFRFKVITSLMRLTDNELIPNINLTDSLVKNKELCASYFNATKMAEIMMKLKEKGKQGELKWIVSDLSILEENIKHFSVALALISDKNITDNISSMLQIIHPYINFHYPDLTSDEQINAVRERDFEVDLLILLRDYIPYLLYWKKSFNTDADYEDPLLDPLEEL